MSAIFSDLPDVLDAKNTGTGTFHFQIRRIRPDEP